MKWLPLLLMITLAGCAGQEPVADMAAPVQDVTPAGNVTTPAPVANTTQTFILLAELADAPETVTLGENLTFLLDSDLPDDIAANASWTITVSDNGTAVANGTGAGLPANWTFTPPAGNLSADVLVMVDGYMPANATLALPLVEEVVLDPATASVLIVDETFSGLLPVGATTGTHTFEVPEGGVYIRFTYTSEHIGLFSAVATLKDAAGQTVFYTIDDCGVALTPGMETDTCVMEKPYEMPAGTWTATVNWQVGQVTEEYTLHVEGFAY